MYKRFTFTIFHEEFVLWGREGARGLLWKSFEYEQCDLDCKINFIPKVTFKSSLFFNTYDFSEQPKRFQILTWLRGLSTINILGHFWRKICQLDVSKITKSGHTESDHLYHTLAEPLSLLLLRPFLTPLISTSFRLV